MANNKSIFQKIKESITGNSAVDKAKSFMSGHGGNLKNGLFHSTSWGERVTPHVEKREIEKMYRNNTDIVAGVEILTNAVMGKNLQVTAEDDRTKEVLEEEWIPKLKQALREAIEESVKSGDGYIEILKGENTNKIMRFRPVSRSQNMYIDYDDSFEPTRYVYEMPRQHRGFQEHTVRYDQGLTKTVYGREIPLDKIIHLQYGVSHIPVYGRSNLASAVNDAKIIEDIERDMAVIARHKALAKIIYEVRGGQGEQLSDDQIKQLKYDMENLGDFDNIIAGNFEFDIKTASYEGAHWDFMPLLNLLRTKITSTLAPSFYTHGDATNYAVANDQKKIWTLSVMSVRDMFKPRINKLLERICLQEGLNTEGLSVDFGNFDFPTDREKEQAAVRDFQAGLLTLNEARDMMGLGMAGEFGDAFVWELQAQQEVQQVNLGNELFSDDVKKKLR